MKERIKVPFKIPVSKRKKSRYVSDGELVGIKGVKSIKQVADTEQQYNDILKDAVITRVATSGSNYITQTIQYNVLEIEADYDYPVYKYIVDGVEYFSNFEFANYVQIIQPINNTDEQSTTA